MSIEDVYKRYLEGEYENTDPVPMVKALPKDHVLDEERSVIWNRQEVERRNQELEEWWKTYRSKCNRLTDRLRSDLIGAIRDEYGFEQSVAERIYSFAYSEKHAYMGDVFGFTSDVCKLVSDCVSKP